MPARGAILAYVREKFGTEPEYPWARYPHYAVLRHQQGRKWYALIMDVPPDRPAWTETDRWRSST